MKIIVGLGNPEQKYDNTYHNMGFNVVNSVAEAMGIKIKKLECRAVVSISKDYILAKPQTYMNLSGESVASLLKKYDASPCDLLVVYDDIDIPAGQIRLRKSGSAGTHNGMRNIINCIGTQDFPRLRVGIGRQDAGELKDYVLSHIPKSMYETFSQVVKKSADAVKDFISGYDFDIIMGKYN